MSRTFKLAMPVFSIMITLSVALAACGGAGPAVGGSDNSIVIVIPEDPPSFNPAIADSGYDYLVMELVMLGLADMDPEGNVFPELAAELPTVENGGVVVDEEAWTMTATWKLRQDVQWADGTPLTADDVIFTYEAIVDPEAGGWVPGIDYVDSIEKVDDHTFTIYFNTVYPGYLTLFGGEQAVIWPAHYCDASQGFTAWDCGRQPLSSGPYVLQEWINGDHLTFVKNENYFEPGKPSLDTITVRIVPDQSVRKTMLINGDADLDMWTTEDVIADLQGEPNVVSRAQPGQPLGHAHLLQPGCQRHHRPGGNPAPDPVGCACATGHPHGHRRGHHLAGILPGYRRAGLDGVLPRAVSSATSRARNSIPPRPKNCSSPRVGPTAMATAFASAMAAKRLKRAM